LIAIPGLRIDLRGLALSPFRAMCRVSVLACLVILAWLGMSLLQSVTRREVAYNPAQAWDVTTDMFGDGSAWPEAKDPRLIGFNDRSASGIAISGGGKVSYAMGHGVWRALNILNLTQNVKYLSGVSGGSWTSTVFTYYARGADGVAADDVELLGGFIPPSELTPAVLAVESPKNMNRFCSEDTNQVFKDFERCFSGKGDCKSSWGEDYSDPTKRGQYFYDLIGRTVMKPVGILPGKSFSWSRQTASDAAAASGISGLTAANFSVRASEDRPFLIDCGTVLGPSSLGTVRKPTPYRIEYTPLYVGVPIPSTEIEYRGLGSDTKNVRLGGLVAPTAYKLDNGLFGIDQAVATSGAFFTSSIVEALSKWNRSLLSVVPVQAVNGELMSMADGAVVDNTGVIDLLIRGVRNVVLVTVNYKFKDVPPPGTPFTGKDIDPSLLGLFLASGNRKGANVVFEGQGLELLLDALQDAHYNGDGIANINLTTVYNKHWHLPSALKINFSVLMLGSWPKWESALPAETQRMMSLRSIATENFFVGGLNLQTDSMNASLGNYLNQMTSAMVLGSEALMRSVFQSSPELPSSILV